MHAMEQCLERVLASDYEKLEIIVFDDSSVDDTSILIRSFAHAGIRFVPGTEVPDGWLGKNHALEVLAREASGEYLVFMDVDTYIQPTTISRLVGQITTEKLDMISVIPRRTDVWRTSVLFGSLRYFWQLILSRRKAPASSSSLWSIRRNTLLDKLGGFAPHKGEVQPEACLASLVEPSAYRCVISNEALGVNYEKKWYSQVETSRRLLYPMVGGKWWTGLIALIVLIILNVPFVTLLTVFIFGWTETQIMAFWLLTAYMGLYGTYTSIVWRQNWWIGGLLWPVVIMQELVLFIYSLWGYARRSITWKGRLMTAKALRADHLEINK
jgi:glycosyltransferase involved in cell wall biosynthesis